MNRYIAPRHAGTCGSFLSAYCRLGKESNGLSAVYSGLKNYYLPEDKADFKETLARLKEDSGILLYFHF